MPRRAIVAVVAVVALAATACSTTVDPDIERALEEAARTEPVTTEAAAETSGIAPDSPLGDLLDELLALATTLSEAIVANDNQHELMADIDQLWAAARPGVDDATSDRVLAQFDTAVALMQRGVDRRRPADADRATINLRNLIATIDTIDTTVED